MIHSIFFCCCCFDDMLQRVWKKKREKAGVLIRAAAFQGSKTCEKAPSSDGYRRTTLGECLACDSGSYSSICHHQEKFFIKRERERSLRRPGAFCLHLFWHMVCILLIQIPWHRD